MSEEQPVAVEVDNSGVAVVYYDRPEAHNTWSLGMERAFHAILRRLDTDPGVGAVVVTGRGTTFCPGADATYLADIAGRPMDLTGRTSPSRMWAFRKPLIAAVNGGCAGVGLVQALMCDVRFAAPRAKFTTAYARRGLPAEYGAAWLLPRIVGAGRALDLLLSARVLTATEAEHIGLVTRVADDVVGEAVAYARAMVADCAPTALATMRHQVYAGLSGDYATSLEGAYRAMALMVGQDSFAEGVASFREGRPAQFPPLPDEFAPAALTRVPDLGLDLVPEEVDVT